MVSSKAFALDFPSPSGEGFEVYGQSWSGAQTTFYLCLVVLTTYMHSYIIGVGLF